MPDTSPPLPRGTKRDRTRAHLLDAAASVIAEKGYDRTSLEDVAKRAGMTRGAIYGNFRNKEALFLAVVATKWQPILPRFAPGAGFADQMDALAEAVIAAMPARRQVAVGAVSFQLYALTHAPMRARIAEANAEIYRQMAQALQANVPDGALPVPAAQFVRVMHALIDGLMLLHALTPELVDADSVRSAFKAIGSRGVASSKKQGLPF
jgi:AcrR family transcriptional regulator